MRNLHNVIVTDNSVMDVFRNIELKDAYASKRDSRQSNICTNRRIHTRGNTPPATANPAYIPMSCKAPECSGTALRKSDKLGGNQRENLLARQAPEQLPFKWHTKHAVHKSRGKIDAVESTTASIRHDCCQLQHQLCTFKALWMLATAVLVTTSPITH